MQQHPSCIPRILHGRSASSSASSSSSSSEFAVDHLVIGGGVVGLAVAARLAESHPNASTLLLERHPQFGMETSSRNSEVIHAGIYYPNDSLKTKLCVQGNHLLYRYCKSKNVPFSRIGKWIVAVSADEADYLSTLQQKFDKIKHPEQEQLRFLSASERELEPNVKSTEVLLSSSTGIIDSHALMGALESDFLSTGGMVAYRSNVVGIEYSRSSASYRIQLEGSDEAIEARCVVNAAGLSSDRIAGLLLDPLPPDYTLHYCKGRYFCLRGNQPLVSRLIYPVPEKNLVGLGVHCTLDLAGKLKFGPDTKYVTDAANLSVDDITEDELDQACRAIQRYLRGIRREDLCMDYAGMRPKLSGPSGSFRDFVVAEESGRGFPGFVNLIGIESPGLTSSLAIADRVEALLHHPATL
ncbi:FAD dependent oxidoreductase [Polychytrium aggregatum]|uniref:FAD dependent oxidoreductase n=1 Tax=Polychytrium aggregatum TaxID=110093 RepID=UPI0022FF29A8|nr:FAD dependent oxidoreductase [Polychytrium aggregatum]KAI9206050.1 FAD dependent oxidoreductase [Polychytrium aggregatum]